MDFFRNLNKSQKEVVTTTDGPVLVLAGAGSGKTRSIIYRTAYLIKVKKVSPWNILIVTFTNKAAKELKYRLKKTFMIPADNMWVGTFHSICAKILRYESSFLKFDSNFSIYDEKDSLTLLKKIFKRLDIDTKKFPISRVRNIISREKNNLVLPDDFFSFHENNYYTEMIFKIFKAYQNALLENNAMDFDDLLVNTAFLLHKNENIREKYSNKFKYVMIDEYQDTNYAQFKIVNLMAKSHGNICVVGDDDQAIYGWRGADVRNILEFEKDYKKVKVIKLERNYRSTKQILDVANDLIKHNKTRHQKILITDNNEGEKPVLKSLDSEYDEAMFIAQKIEELLSNGYNAYDIAVFYRTNAQSRIFEKVFTTFGIKYKLVGSINFFARKEIKDVLAYLKILVNPNDDISFLRIINFPKRGIGKKALETLINLSQQTGKSLYNTLKDNISKIPEKIRKKFEKFLMMTEKWNNLQSQTDLTSLIETVVQESGIANLYENSKDIQDISKWENISELIASVEEFVENFEEDREPLLEEYLNQVSIQTSIDNSADDKNSISLMTIHNAKGLEFDCVFISGLEEGLLPHIKSLEDDTVEEERRLFYVAITRAKKKLYITYANYRRYMETIEPTIMSRFLSEIDTELLDIDTEKKIFNKKKRKQINIVLESEKLYRIGQKISHPQFGIGTVINVDGADENAKLTISFNNGELKKIIGKYVKIL